MPDEVIILISHQSPGQVTAMRDEWQRLNPHAEVHVAYGGTREAYESLNIPNATWIPDPRLRTRDHPRERQSYLGLMRSVAAELEGRKLENVLLVEFDVAPLRAGLMDYLGKRAHLENADVMGINLRRIDGTNHAHYLAHITEGACSGWLDFSVRDDRSVVMMMLGCLTWWTWEAFRCTASQDETMPVYLELAMPTVAHHLGFRVRELAEFSDDVVVMGERSHEITKRQAEGAWVLHPCKRIWDIDSRPSREGLTPE